MSRKLTWLIVLVIILTGLAIGYYQYNRGPADIEHALALETDAQTLYKSYLMDSAQANRSFNGKVLLLNGMVESVSNNANNKQVVLLASGQPGASVNCTMEKADQSILAGQAIKIKGIVTGFIEGDPILGLAGDVYLDRCYRQTK